MTTTNTNGNNIDELERLNQLFANRYTDEDEEYNRMILHSNTPPIVEDWANDRYTYRTQNNQRYYPSNNYQQNRNDSNDHRPYRDDHSQHRNDTNNRRPYRDDRSQHRSYSNNRQPYRDDRQQHRNYPADHRHQQDYSDHNRRDRSPIRRETRR